MATDGQKGDNDKDDKFKREEYDDDDDDEEKQETREEPPKKRKIIDILPPTSLMKESEVFKKDTFYITGVDQEIKDYCTRLIFTGWGRLHHVIHQGITKFIVGPNAGKEEIA